MGNDPPERVAAIKVASSNANGRGSPMIGTFVRSDESHWATFGIVVDKQENIYVVKWFEPHRDYSSIEKVDRNDLDMFIDFYLDWVYKNDRIIR